MTDKPGPNLYQVSPEYKAKCMEWALRASQPMDSPENIVKAAEAFYAYVYGSDVRGD